MNNIVRWRNGLLCVEQAKFPSHLDVLASEYVGLCPSEASLAPDCHFGLGHELVVKRDGLRYVLTPFVTCGRCGACHSGDFVQCSGVSVPSLAWEGHGGLGGAVPLYDERFLMSLPPTERPYTYVLCEPFAAGISAVEGAEGSTIGVVGLGPVGLGSALWGLAKKQRVIAIGRHGWQLSVARSVGMDAYHELEALPSSVAEHVIVAAATQSALSIACDLVAARGTIHLVGMNVDSEDWRAGAGGGYEFFRRSLTVRHCYMYSLGHVREALVLICSYEKLLQEAIIGPINLSDLDGKFPIGLAGRRMIVSPPHS